MGKSNNQFDVKLSNDFLKANSKLSALIRIMKYLDFKKIRILFMGLFETQWIINFSRTFRKRWIIHYTSLQYSDVMYWII